MISGINSGLKLAQLMKLKIRIKKTLKYFFSEILSQKRIQKFWPGKILTIGNFFYCGSSYA